MALIMERLNKKKFAIFHYYFVNFPRQKIIFYLFIFDIDINMKKNLPTYLFTVRKRVYDEKLLEKHFLHCGSSGT